MPQLQELTVKKEYLPSFSKKDAAWVMLETPTKISDFADIQGLEQTVQISTVIANKIKKWNLEGKDGKILEINAKNVSDFNATDYSFLIFKLKLEKMMTSMDATKKNN